MLQELDVVKVDVNRELTGYEIRLLGEALSTLGFYLCLLNGKELKVEDMCKTNKTWDHVWEKFDQGKEGID